MIESDIGLRAETRDGVRTIWFDRPDRRNAQAEGRAPAFAPRGAP